MSIFSREKIVNSCPNAVKWLYLLVQFSKIFRGSMPPDPPREVPPLSVPEKNPTFSQNLNGSTGVFGPGRINTSLVKKLANAHSFVYQMPLFFVVFFFTFSSVWFLVWIKREFVVVWGIFFLAVCRLLPLRLPPQQCSRVVCKGWVLFHFFSPVNFPLKCCMIKHNSFSLSFK